MKNKKRYSISRIHTSKGAFRLKGTFTAAASENQISYESVEFMGTDGWCQMDLNSKHTKSLLSEIEREIVNHVTR